MECYVGIVPGDVDNSHECSGLGATLRVAIVARGDEGHG